MSEVESVSGNVTCVHLNIIYNNHRVTCVLCPKVQITRHRTNWLVSLSSAQMSRTFPSSGLSYVYSVTIRILSCISIVAYLLTRVTFQLFIY